MKQTFRQTIHHHSLEFNRLLYPLRYQVQLEDMEVKEKLIEIVKDGNGEWEIKEDTGIPQWFHLAFEQIRSAITENEAGA